MPRAVRPGRCRGPCGQLPTSPPASGPAPVAGRCRLPVGTVASRHRLCPATPTDRPRPPVGRSTVVAARRTRPTPGTAVGRLPVGARRTWRRLPAVLARRLGGRRSSPPGGRARPGYGLTPSGQLTRGTPAGGPRPSPTGGRPAIGRRPAGDAAWKPLGSHSVATARSTSRRAARRARAEARDGTGRQGRPEPPPRAARAAPRRRRRCPRRRRRRPRGPSRGRRRGRDHRPCRRRRPGPTPSGPWPAPGTGSARRHGADRVRGCARGPPG